MRVGSFNPGTQGPVEPSGSCAGRISQYEDDLSEVQSDIYQEENEIKVGIDTIRNIKENLKIRWKARRRLMGDKRELEEWISDEEEYSESLSSQMKEIANKIEMLLEDFPEDHPDVLKLRKKQKEIRSNL